MTWLKRQWEKSPILIIGTAVALLSCFFVPPDREYRHYLDGHTLSILFGLLLIIEGLKEEGLLVRPAFLLYGIAGNSRRLAFFLVFLPFFSSMLMTNDVALITFVPLALLVLRQANLEKYTLSVVIGQTLAANLGCMFTPVGSPQNLFLSHRMKMGFADMARVMGSYVLLSAVLLATFICFCVPRKELNLVLKKPGKHSSYLSLVYCILFCIALLCVSGRVPTGVFLALTVLCTAVSKRALFLRVDYALLLTFVVFFIFVGNLGRLSSFRAMITPYTEKNVFFVSLFLSQITSNVPATLLLYPFAQPTESLLIGVNLGGLGTLVASMASVISYRFVMSETSVSAGTYLKKFTFWNGVFLIVLVWFHLMKS